MGTYAKLDLVMGTETVGIKLMTIARRIKETKAQTHYASPCCLSRTGRKNYCKECGEIFDQKPTHRIFGDKPEEQVVLKKSEIDRLKSLTNSGKFVIDAVCRDGDVPTLFTDKAYYVVPQEEEDEAILTEIFKALTLTGTAIIGRYVTRNNEHLAVIRTFGGGLICQNLFWAQALYHEPEKWELVEDSLSVEEANQGIQDFLDVMTEDFDWSNFEWEYYEQFKELVTQVADRDVSELEAEAEEEEVDVGAKSVSDFGENLAQVAKEKKALQEAEVSE